MSLKAEKARIHTLSLIPLLQFIFIKYLFAWYCRRGGIRWCIFFQTILLDVIGRVVNVRSIFITISSFPFAIWRCLKTTTLLKDQIWLILTAWAFHRLVLERCLINYVDCSLQLCISRSLWHHHWKFLKLLLGIDSRLVQRQGHIRIPEL